MLVTLILLLLTIMSIRRLVIFALHHEVTKLCLSPFSVNLEVLDSSNGKSYMKKIMPKYEEVVIEEDASLSFVSFLRIMCVLCSSDIHACN